jgi:HlyD family secretion protein
VKKLFSILAVAALAGCRWIGNSSPALSGTVEMTEHSLGARVAGRLDKVLVEEGGPVKAGQVVAVLDRAGQAERDFQRAQRLYRSGEGTQQALELAGLARDDQNIVSPVDGVVLLKVRESGEVVPAGGTVAVVGEDQKMWVRVYVPEGRLARVRLGQEAAVAVDGLDAPFRGRVSWVAPRAEFTPRNAQTPEERATHTFAVKVALLDPPPGVRAGLSADVTVADP